MLATIRLWAGILLVYGGGLIAVIGAISSIKPLTFLRIRTRGAGLRLVAAGVAALLLGFMVPISSSVHIGEPRTALDRFMPTYQFNEVHSTRVHASPEGVYRAVRAVTADEILLFRTLTWIRSPRLAGRAESILNPQRTTPILDVALRTTFKLLADVPNRELVVGTIVCCERPPPIRSVDDVRRLTGGNFAIATMNFFIQDQGNGWTRLDTETRVFATSDGARRRFAIYWRVIYPGSALIRRMWLRAIKQRAERS